MAKDKCIIRIEDTLKRSSITRSKAEEIITEIKKAQTELKLQNLDDDLVEQLSEEVLKRQEIQKKINQRNSIENEIKIRNTVDYVLKEFPNDPVEGLKAVLVGSNAQKAGSRASVALAQLTQYRQIVVSFNERLRQKNLEEIFANANEDIDRRISRTIWQISKGENITEKQTDIIELAKLIDEFSETIRKKYNNYGANIGKLPGWIVRQSHDPFQLRNALDVLNLKNNVAAKEINGGSERNFNAWREYIKDKLDEKTFEGYDGDRDEFLHFVYHSLIRNDHQVTNGAGGSYGTRDITNKINAKRVLHFKTADDWFDYNSKFGGGNLRESLFAGFNYAGRNIGIMSMLGTKTQDAFKRIGKLVTNNLIKKEKDNLASKVSEFTKPQGGYEKYMAEIDGSVNSVVNFGAARHSAIVRSILSMAKLGGAVVSAIADVHLYGRELSYQGRSYLGGIAEALGRLGKIKNTKQKQAIAEQLGFIADNVIYDLASRYSVGDMLNKRFTKLQRTFFKLNLLQWWTNSLKEGVMLGMGNHIAKQKSISFKNLDEGTKRIFNHYGVTENIWEVVRKLDMEKADDGKEFFSVKNIDKLTDQQIKNLANLEKMSARQIEIFKDNLKTKMSGVFLDRSTFAIIKPDSRNRSYMKQGKAAGTPIGEALRFMMQFKAFPIAILQKALGRELSFYGAGQKGRAFWGVASLVVGSGIFGYISMTAKDLLRGKSPKDPKKIKTYYNAMLQGGGLGIYGDFLFSESYSGYDLLATAGGPGLTEFAKAANALRYAVKGEFSKSGKQAYKSIVGNIPFLNLFYLKTAFDYAIGYQIMETISPGYLRRMEKRMQKETGQEFLLTKPSTLFKGF
mgnify:CR=1 FL=1